MPVREDVKMSDSIPYIINDKDARVAVIIPIKEFEHMLAEIGLTLDDYEREPSGALRTVLDQMRAAGKIEI
jgi:hypothetical protein